MDRRRAFIGVRGAVIAAVLLVVSVMVTAAAQVTAPAQTESAFRSASSGVFSQDQAERGESIYLDECGRCHSETLGGGDFGPPVVGIGFREAWKDRTAADLFELVRTTMPQDNPGRLTDAQTVDILAFLIKRNGFPPGRTPLSADPAQLHTIRLAPP